MARISLAQQIADLDAPAPVDIDPEVIFNDLHIQSSDVSRAHYVDVGKSTLRKLHDNIADPKYDGVKVSRTQLAEEDDDHSFKSSGEEEEEEEQNDESREEIRQVETVHQPSDEGATASEDSKEDEAEMIATEDRSAAVDITLALRKTQDEDRKKGLAVSRQIARINYGIWDSLLDARIRIQKSISSSNTLPSSSTLTQNDPRYGESLSRMLNEAASLSEQMFELQELLLQTDDSIQLPPRKRRRLENVQTLSQSDIRGYLVEACEDVSHLEEMYHPHLVQTLSKWSSKIQAVAPSVLLPSNRNAFFKDRQHLKTAVQLVDESLSTHDKILHRTQLWRGKGQRLGVKTEEGGVADADVEIFDDTDFYQQLLRDVIDARNDAGTNDWMAVQKQKKAKKKVDTKASKGRKLRYDVHEKLQNFMAPIHVKGTWHEEQIDELFTSLLGRGFEEAINAQANEVVGPREDPGESSGAYEGFRVFG
ncbi:apoptosis-antagonizing transcription factor [Lentinula aff. lateritia]|uniref:Apoptosis-antagonizing transcription factor n=1 Tax=Lentinula aff. lateritia TaxID=2804960 RepID=A0ACC1UBG5_9AGAR|nr:apoptosis-antagonizing transcription factor [Lentinula aff. lateritia]